MAREWSGKEPTEELREGRRGRSGGGVENESKRDTRMEAVDRESSA